MQNSLQVEMLICLSGEVFNRIESTFLLSRLVQGIQFVKCIAKNAVTWFPTCIQQHNHLPTRISADMVGLVLVFAERLIPQGETKWFRTSNQIHGAPACVSLSMLGNNSHGSTITPQWAMTGVLLSTPDLPQPCALYFHSRRLISTAELCLDRQASWWHLL